MAATKKVISNLAGSITGHLVKRILKNKSERKIVHDSIQPFIEDFLSKLQIKFF